MDSYTTQNDITLHTAVQMDVIYTYMVININIDLKKQ